MFKGQSLGLRVHWPWLVVGAMVPAAATVFATAPITEKAPSQAIPGLMHAKLWRVGQDPAGFLVSEKFDGVRAYWDGQVLRFRSGRPIAAPAWFTAALPKTPLDGELWLGRGRFDALSAAVRRSVPEDTEWRELRYLVFDLPGASGPFAERVLRLSALTQSADQPWLQAVNQQRVGNTADLQTLLKQVVADGGEGLVLHRAKALWSPGRQDALLKYKLSPDDEARVVGHLPGRGRLAGRVGALLMEMPDGQRFALGAGLTDALRETPPAVGSVVTYRYRGSTLKGLPRFASFVRVRETE